MAAVTGQTIVNNALTILGILEQGGVASASDSNDALTELNAMWEAWGIDEGLIYAVVPVAGAGLVSGTGSYTIGMGGTFSVARPTRFYEAFFVASTGLRTALNIVEQKQYYSHRDLAATAQSPDELYPDFNVTAAGYITLFLWPVPVFSGTASLAMEVGVPFTVWTLGGTYQLPYGYEDAIDYALAFRLIPRFGNVVVPSVAQSVAVIGEKAEQRIRAMNMKNRQLPAEAMAIPQVMPMAQQAQR